MSDNTSHGSIPPKPNDLRMPPVQGAVSFATLTCTEHTEDSFARPFLTPVLNHSSQGRYEGQALPPMRLQTAQPTPSALPASPMSIARLLSSDSPSPMRPGPRTHPSPHPLCAAHCSPMSWRHREPIEYQSQQGLFKPMLRHEFDHSPASVGPAHPSFSRTPAISQAHPALACLDRDELLNRVNRSPSTTSRPHTPDYHENYSKPSSGQIEPRKSTLPDLDYHLSIRQQPTAARACGFGERDRRTIDPPPIVELKITDKTTNQPEQDPSALLALHCTLLSHDGGADECEPTSPQPDTPPTRQLMGTLVASPYQAKDNNGIAGTFFVFPDLSCRHPGRFQLSLTLLRVDPTNMLPGAVHGSVAKVVTDVFIVYTAKDFPGMRASSALLKSLRRQGLNVGVKKGSEARTGRSRMNKRGISSDEDDGSAGLELGDGWGDGGRSGAGLVFSMSAHGMAAPQHQAKRRKTTNLFDEERALRPFQSS